MVPFTKLELSPGLQPSSSSSFPIGLGRGPAYCVLQATLQVLTSSCYLFACQPLVWILALVSTLGQLLRVFSVAVWIHLKRSLWALMQLSGRLYTYIRPWLRFTMQNILKNEYKWYINKIWLLFSVCLIVELTLSISKTGLGNSLGVCVCGWVCCMCAGTLGSQMSLPNTLGLEL